MRRVLTAMVAAMALSGCGMTNEQIMALSETMKDVGAQMQTSSPAPPAASPVGPVCLLQGQELSGMYRSCAYSCGGGIVWRSIGAAELCPMRVPSP